MKNIDDLECPNDECGQTNCAKDLSCYMLDKGEVKQEAINIIKFMDDGGQIPVTNKFGFDRFSDIKPARKMLMWFANLSEEDLK